MTLVVSLVCIKKGIIISVVMVSVLSFKMVDQQLVNFITCRCESSAPFFVIYKAGCEPVVLVIGLYEVVRSNDLTH
jgi:hypothetical protein